MSDQPPKQKQMLKGQCPCGRDVKIVMDGVVSLCDCKAMYHYNETYGRVVCVLPHHLVKSMYKISIVPSKQ